MFESRFSDLIKDFYQRTSLIPCTWRFFTITPTVKHLKTCPVCYQNLQTIETYQSNIIPYYLGIIDKRLYLLPRPKAKAITTSIINNKLYGKTVSFSLSDIDGTLRAFIKESYPTYIESPILVDYKKVLPNILSGKIPFFNQSDEGTIYYTRHESFSGYFYPYHFHKEEAFPHLGFSTLAPLYDRFGFDLEIIIQELPDEQS